ncbi:MAG: hypothetical protein P8189_22200 [Anaerolineae bacterium]
MAKIRWLAWLVLLLAGCGCSAERVVFQDLLLSDCVPPCWRGVVPGETSRQQILDLLVEPPDTEPGLPLLEWGRRCVNRGYSLSQVKILLDSAGVAESIRLVNPANRLTFQDAVDELGLPALVLMTPCSPETDLGFLYLVYPEQGIAVGSGFVPVLDRPWQQPPAGTRVYQRLYFAPIPSDRFEARAGPIYGCGMSYANEASAWQGFGPE